MQPESAQCTSRARLVDLAALPLDDLTHGAILPCQTAGVLRVGLTGGIGSGKSEVSRRLAARGAFVIDADVLAREVVGPGTDGLAAVVEQFGHQVVGPDGALDRAALAVIVFAETAMRRRLERIIHPRVSARAAQLEATAPADAVVVHDIPLLVETGQQHQFDVVVVVDVAEEEQRRRLACRGVDDGEADSRITAQAPRAARLAAADVVIDNNGSLDDLDAAVDDLWQSLRSRRA